MHNVFPHGEQDNEDGMQSLHEFLEKLAEVGIPCVRMLLSHIIECMLAKQVHLLMPLRWPAAGEHATEYHRCTSNPIGQLFCLGSKAGGGHMPGARGGLR